MNQIYTLYFTSFGGALAVFSMLRTTIGHAKTNQDSDLKDFLSNFATYIASFRNPLNLENVQTKIRECRLKITTEYDKHGYLLKEYGCISWAILTSLVAFTSIIVENIQLGKIMPKERLNEFETIFTNVMYVPIGINILIIFEIIRSIKQGDNFESLSQLARIKDFKNIAKNL